MSKKNYDKKNRFRSKVVAVRTSPAEAENLDLKVALSGLSKQDYVIKALNESSFTVQATTRMRKGVREQIGAICAELRRLHKGNVISEELAEKLEIIAQFAGSFADVESPVEGQDELIKKISRTGGHTDQSLPTSPSVDQPKEGDDNGAV